MSIELIATTIKMLNEHTTAPVNNSVVIATPTASGTIADVGGVNSGLIRNLIAAARTACVADDGSIIAGAASKLKKMGVILHTAKMTGYNGAINAMVYFWTTQGIIVIYQHPSIGVLADMVNWGIPPKVQYVEKIVEREKIVKVEVKVPAEPPVGFFNRLKFLFG